MSDAVTRAWARTWLTRLAAFLLLIPFGAALTSAGVTMTAKSIAAIVLLVSLVLPAWGLVSAGVLLPIVALWHRPPDVVNDAVSLIAAAIVLGAFLRLRDDAHTEFRWPSAWLLGAIIVLSLALGRSIRWAPAVCWLEGLGLALLAARISSSHRREARIAAAGSIVAAGAIAMASIVELFRIAARTASPVNGLFDAFLGARVSPVFADPNAAGSYFAMFATAAAYLCFAGPRGRRWLPVAIVLGLGLWLTGSRAAMASAAIALASAWVVARRPSRVLLSAAGLITISLVSYLIFAPPSRRLQAPSSYAARVRVEMAHVALAVTAEHPLLGVGLGQFQEASRAFITPEFAATFRPATAGENAHNNFLQILAELGIAGLVAFLALLVGPMRSGWSAVARLRSGRTDVANLKVCPTYESAALAAGVTALLISCLAGHPFLSSEVLLAFLFSLGLIVGLRIRRPGL